MKIKNKVRLHSWWWWWKSSAIKIVKFSLRARENRVPRQCRFGSSPDLVPTYECMRVECNCSSFVLCVRIYNRYIGISFGYCPQGKRTVPQLPFPLYCCYIVDLMWSHISLLLYAWAAEQNNHMYIRAKCLKVLGRRLGCSLWAEYIYEDVGMRGLSTSPWSGLNRRRGGGGDLVDLQSIEYRPNL